MATRQWYLAKGQSAQNVVEQAGSAIPAAGLEVTIDLAAYRGTADIVADLNSVIQNILKSPNTPR